MIRSRTIPLLFAAAMAAVLASPATGAPPAPSLVTPNDGAVLDALPAFGWTPAAGADKYEWEIAADAGFNSPVLGGTHDHFFTMNTRATMTKVVPNGTYWWRARAIAKDGSVSPWSPSRTITKNWAAAPTLQRPANGAAITFPADPFRLTWSAVPGAAKYLVSLATDPSLGSPLASVETQATSFTLSAPLTPDQTYYWGIVPLDAAGNRGGASPVWRFTWRWPSTTTPQVTDVASAVEIYDHRFSWTPVPGAAGYEVEVNTSSDFAAGSKVCCPVAPLTRRTTIGTSYSPTLVLPNNNAYYWRVRALDASGNAGVWNEGPTFMKAFDDVLPSVKNLRMLDNPSPGTADFATSTPIVAWDPVPGASSYEVEVVPYVGGCQWTWPREQHWTSSTSSTTWTPLGSGWNRVKPFQNSLSVSSDAPSLVAGNSYCVRVTALDRPSDSVSRHIRSAETYLPDAGAPAFRWVGPVSGGACTPSCNVGAPGSDDYLLPARGGTIRRMSLFRWKPLAGYDSYFVLVARDPDFTNLVDYAFTEIPAYAPRAQNGPRTYADETTLSYWAILPATRHDGSGVVTAPRFAAAADFHKQSIPPNLLAPTDGTVFTGAPTFHWTPAEVGRRYRLQVSQDPAFSATQIEEDVLTDSTAYTSAATYPADTNLYWRVRADAESVDIAAGVALTWSRTGVFRKTLAAPVPEAGNPKTGDAVPTWEWGAVPGAVSYDFELDFPNGVSRLFQNIPAAAATPVILKGTGIWNWRVRANFPQVTTSSFTKGPWSTTESFTRTIREPGGGQEDAGPGRVLLQWASKLGALNYRVQISTRADFSTFVQRTTTENSSFAPLMTERAYADGGTFYWRVAAADDDVTNVGDFSPARTFSLPGVVVVPPRAATRVSAIVRTVRRSIAVSGTVAPAHPRMRVTVTLQRKKGARFVRVATKRPVLTSANRYTTSFRRPRPGRCKVIVQFAGDADHLSSRATRTFRC